MLRLIAGLETATAGRIEIDGRDVTRFEPVDRRLAMVFQSYALYPHMTVRGNMAFALETAGSPRAEIDRRVREAARVLKLEGLLDRRPAQLSGGQRQRVAIGRAIVREPVAFLFDEPLSNLDAALRIETRQEIARLHQQLGATTIYVTHDQVEAMTLADKIVVLKDGRVMQAGAPMELYLEPANEFVAGFLGSPSMNFLDVEVRDVRDGRATVANAGLAPVEVRTRGAQPTPGSRARLGVRPQNLTVLEDVTLPPGAGLLRGTVELSERLGSETVVDVVLPDRSRIVATLSRDAVFLPGQDVTLTFIPEQAHLFVR
ncbi:maltose/maltodextrin ABC transporter, ATP-binding protein [Rubellimicrobium mesophilum DSM 19309]|uniref:Maltose/maltodextrin ABC transporter, ATP-binding protein n=1 Tax=Rubellimicrobium mesophilum DSM 19309 TaxID=442562 RepID=A0A017HLB3_9RHOB|nr:maltose/maltodextrin ABC transporter, ATP-binding protein [Rubellimicrobium mesophilum DSM 19309]